MRYWVFILGIFLASLAADGALILSGVVAEVGLEFLGIRPSPWVFLVALVVVILLIWGVPKLISSRKARRNHPPLA
jgi:hypothetical protein